MLNSLQHGGPDDEGIFIEGNISFGHRRLSIIDLSSAGHQPMLSHNENSVISYNGEVYNYLVLKKELELLGAVFKTKMDPTHPLSFGLGTTYYTLKTSASNYQWLPSNGNAIFLDDKPIYYGFTGKKAYEKINKTLIAGREQTGSGGIVYFVDNPLFRSFWNSGKVLFSNGLFF